MTESENYLDLIEHQAVELHERWHSYRRLFGAPDRTQLLNDSAPALFRLIAELFREGILSSLFRLTDAAKTGRKANVSIQSLPVHCPNIGPRLQEQVRVLCELAEELRNIRNKFVGHADLVEARQGGVRAAPEFDESKFESVLELIRQVVDSARDEIRGEGIDFDYEVDTAIEADYLFGIIKRQSDRAPRT